MSFTQEDKNNLKQEDMSSGQLGIVPDGPINDDKILTPKTINQTQVHRNEAADGSGTYYGKRGVSGLEEEIGGPGSTIDKILGETGLVNVVSDGSNATFLTIQLDTNTAWAVGNTITNTTTGATAEVVSIVSASGGKRVKMNNLTAGDWSIGDSVTNGTLATVIGSAGGTNPPGWSFAVSTTKKITVIHFNSRRNDAGDQPFVFSYGKETYFGLKDCIASSSQGFVFTNVGISILLRDGEAPGANGWLGATGVTPPTSNLFYITLQRLPGSSTGLSSDIIWTAVEQN